MEADTPGAMKDGEAAPAGEGQKDDTTVQETLEQMLSKKNLVRDQFLAGNMNPQMYIPIRILLAHEKLKNINATQEQIVAVATRSAKLGIDDEQRMVRPLLKSKRNVIIVRDVPDGTTEEEIRELFAGAPHADKIVSVKPEVNNMWFVKFNLDDGTQDVVLWLRSQKFKGSPVNAAIKSEHFLRSFFPLHPPGGMPPMPMMSYPMPPMDFSGGEQGGQEFDGSAGGGWPAEMPPPEGMPPMPPQVGLQPPGYWQPWGARYQPPPLIFTDSTTLAPGSMPAVAQQADPDVSDILDNLEPKGWQDGGKEYGGGKGKWGKGKWGKEAGKGKWGEDYYGKGKGYDEKGGKGKAAPWWQWEKGGWQEKGGWEEKGQRKGKGKKGDGEDGKGKGKRAKGEKGEKGHNTASMPEPLGAPPGMPTPSEVLSSSGGVPPIAVYKHRFRKYDRAQFDEICEAVKGETLEKPEALAQFGDDVPVFREAPSVDLAPALA